MTTALVLSNAAEARAELGSWRSPEKSMMVAGSMDWHDAVRRFREKEFDLLWPEGEQCCGYRLKDTFAISRLHVQELTKLAFPRIAGSIA